MVFLNVFWMNDGTHILQEDYYVVKLEKKSLGTED